jgi:hypothetical protein
MHIVPFLILCLAALLAFLDWYVTAPRRWGHLSLAVCLFIIGITLVFILHGHPNINIGD